MARICFELDDDYAQKLKALSVDRTGSLKKQSEFVASIVKAEIDRSEER